MVLPNWYLLVWSLTKPYAHTLVYVWTAPWSNLSSSVENILRIEAKAIQKRKVKAWNEAKKSEFTYVSFAVKSAPPSVRVSVADECRDR